MRGKRKNRALLLASAGTSFAAMASSAQGLTFNVTFTTNVTSLSYASSVESAVAYVESQYEADFSNPITVNITVDAMSGGLGESETNLAGFYTYSQIKTALATTVTTPVGIEAAASLPATNPAPTNSYVVSTAQGKALGLLSASSASDGTFLFGTGVTYTFNPSARAVAGEYDFIGVADHEFSEIMGRIGILGHDFSGTDAYGLLDLYGYTGPGALDLSTNQAGVNFSINDGTTLLKLYNNGSDGGDNKDWDSPGFGNPGETNDAYNGFSSQGVENDISNIDLEEMNAIGYNVVPEPASASVLALGGLILLTRHRRSRT